MSKQKFQVIQIWLCQHDALCDLNYLGCNPHTVSQPTQWAVWHGGLGRPGSAGVVCWTPPILKKLVVFKWIFMDF